MAEVLTLLGFEPPERHVVQLRGACETRRYSAERAVTLLSDNSIQASPG